MDASAFLSETWNVLTYLRLVPIVLLVWAIGRLPGFEVERNSKAVSGARASTQFDPLMALRALAAAMVLFGHYFMVSFAYPHAAGTFNRHDAIGTCVRIGWILVRASPWSGVWVFFTLSGFLMGKAFFSGRYSLHASGIRAFYRNRMLRIVPLYAAATLLFGALLTPAILLPANWWQLISIGTFNYGGDLPFNPVGALWSVSTEVQFYLLAPFLSILLLQLHRRMPRGFALFPVAILVAGMVLRVSLLLAASKYASSALQDPIWYSLIYAPLVTNLDLFLAGMSFSLLRQNRASRFSFHFPFSAALTLAALALYVVSALGYAILASTHPRYHQSVMPLATSSLALLYIGLVPQRRSAAQYVHRLVKCNGHCSGQAR